MVGTMSGHARATVDGRRNVAVVTGRFVGTTRVLVGQEAETGPEGSAGGAHPFTKIPPSALPAPPTQYGQPKVGKW